jgi:hypothetical protein
MKRIQFWSLLLGLTFGSLAFVACGDDDDTSNVTTATLAGTEWYEEQFLDGKFLNYVTYIFDKNGHVSFGNLGQSDEDGKWHKWTRHTYDYTISGNKFSWFRGEDKTEGTYSINGDVLTLKINGRSTELTLKRMTGKVLNLYNNAIQD